MLKSGNPYYARSLISASLEIDTFNFDIFSDDTTLTDFERNTPLTYYNNDNQMGIFYVQKISRISKNSYRFECTSTIGLLDESYHNGGIYTGQTAKEIIEDICSPLPVIVKTNIQNIKLYGWLPIATRRENLCQAVFAIGATVKVDYNGVIRIEGLWNGQASEIDASRVYSGGSVKYGTKVTQIVVTEHAYNQTATETTELFDGTASYGDKITFSEPCYDLVAEGFSVIESHANYAIVTAGSGKLTGKKYTHTTRNITKNLSESRFVDQSDNVVKVENATLVSLLNANTIADRLAKYYKNVERITTGIVMKRESPGDVVSVYHPYYEKMIVGCIESSDVTVSNKLKSSETILAGYTPPDIGEQEYYDTVDLITESGKWVAPENVLSIRVVLIGGGCGGNSGNKGKNGEETISTIAGKGGEGGLGGSGGKGGKINQIEISVFPASEHTIKIGEGGKGGIFEGEGNNEGLEGGETTFDDYTSSVGASSPTGIIDPVNGNTYGQIGKEGEKGGNGGDGGSIENGNGTGEQGKNIGDNKGGTGGQVAYKDSTTYGENYSCGGGGGGASRNANGENGENGSLSFFDDIQGKGPGYSADDGSGGNGANATEIPIQETNPGRGGIGGFGGGGGGGMGARKAKDPSGFGTRIGVGGNGSNGGDGAPGCVLIYYRVYRPKSNGRFLTRGGVPFNEKYDRMVVV